VSKAATAPPTPPPPAKKHGKSLGERMLDGIERIGNKVPHPAMIFLALCVIVIVLSALLAWANVSATYEVSTPKSVPAQEIYAGGTDNPSLELPPDATYQHDYETTTETTHVESLLTADGIRFIFTSAVDNFNDFGVVAVILVAMIGVGLAEEAGLIAALIRKLVKVAPRRALTFVIVLLGGLSSIASDAGYLVLIPLGAVAFLSVGRHPLAGIAAAFAGVSAAFSVNILITPVDGIITEITNEAAAAVAPDRTLSLTANLYFNIASTLAMALVMTIVTERLIEPRLGRYSGKDDQEHTEEGDGGPAAESRGLRGALIGAVAVIALVTLLTAIPGAPLRNPDTGSIVEDSPFMDSLIFTIMLVFLAAGLGYGIGARTIKGSNAVMDAITKTFAGLGGLIFLLLIIAQFIAYFNYSKMATIAAVKLAEVLEHANVGPLWLMIGLILVTMVLDLIMPGVIPKWAILAPIFIPLFLRLGVAPQTVLAAYRIGDSPMNVITPLMVYLPFIVLVAQKYRKEAGVGTIVALMIPYTLIVAVTWILFYVAWFLIGIPFGPGAPVHIN
jgi:para-aminobenzoyl-glutamate transporter family